MTSRPKRENQEAGFGSYDALAPQYKGMTAQSAYIPMRDGVRLAAEVILPRNLPRDAKVPTLLSQTRYWRAAELRAPLKWFLRANDLEPHFKDFHPFFTSHGYALVTVDVRGTGASFGTWSHPWPQESFEDAREIVDWIVTQPWSDGKVGGYGISYMGTTAELLTALNHPAVKCTVPMFNHPDAYVDIAFPGGIFNERFIQAWGHFDQILDRNLVPQELGPLGRLLLKGVKPVDGDQGPTLLQAAIRAHEENGDAHQLARCQEFRDQHLAGMNVCLDDMAVHQYKEEIERSHTAMFGWGSWMDAGTADAVIRRFLTYDNAQRAVIGAWEHGGRFSASPYRPSNLLADPPLPGQWLEMLRFFDAYLKDGVHDVRSERVLFYYTIGEEEWKRTAVWPPKGATSQRWYLAENHTLSPKLPSLESGADTYTVDFEASTGNYNRWWEMNGLEQKTVIYGDRAEAARHLLTYPSPPLTENTEFTGYPVVTLYVTSTETDGAFFVYLEDLDEQGCVTYVTEGQLRAIHRKVSTDTRPYQSQVPYHSFKKADAAPLVRDEITELTFGLQPTSVLIKKGHRIRIGIAWHDKGTFIRIPTEGTPVITVLGNNRYASCIDLPVVSKS